MIRDERSIGHISQVPPGEGRNFDVDGIMVTVFRTRTGELFATQPKCPHRNGPLADGLLGSNLSGMSAARADLRSTDGGGRER